MRAGSSLKRRADGPAGIVLAAGLGSRLGGGKMLLPYRGKPLLAHVLAAVYAAGGLSRLVLVLGREAEAVCRALADSLPEFAAERPDVVINPAPERGMGISLGLGLAALLDKSAPHAVAVFLGDQPLIRPETLRRLYAAHAEARARDPEHPATAPEYEGRRGNPVILSSILFPELLRLSGDAGARGLLAGLGPGLLRLPVDDPGVVHDVDTPEAYQALRAYPFQGLFT